MMDTNDEVETTKMNHTTENVKSVGQMILGEIEKIARLRLQDSLKS